MVVCFRAYRGKTPEVLFRGLVEPSGGLRMGPRYLDGVEGIYLI